MISTKKKLLFQKYIRSVAALLLSGSLFCSQVLSVCADTQSNEERLEAQRAMAIQSNETPNWPAGPVVSAEAAILMEADTGTILYSKNIHQKEYPASTTKILTTLIATEQCSLDEVVTFSHDAVFDNPPGSSGIAMDVGQTLTMEQCLNAILIRSANEVCFAVAEHMTGTTDWSVFAGIMNERAKELGCLNSNFVNPNGLPDENHYTTAYDLAMIGRAFFANEMLCKISLSKRLEIPASDTVPEAKIENNAMQIIPGGKYAYEYLVGCKTGYTNAARSCLVSCAEKDGMKLICVVMKEESPHQFDDTISLFEYGFSNFQKLNVAAHETKYTVDNNDFFQMDNEVFGGVKSILSIDPDAGVVIPVTAVFDDMDSSLSYEEAAEGTIAVIDYTYHGLPVGSAAVNAVQKETKKFDFEEQQESENTGESVQAQDSVKEESENKEDAPNIIFVNVKLVIFWIVGISVFLILLFVIRAIIGNYQFAKRRKIRTRHKKRKRGTSPFDDFDF